MVSRRILVPVTLVVLTLLQTGCCCQRRNVFRVQNSPCCAPTPKAACCDATSYKRFGYGAGPIVEPPMSVMPQAVLQPQAR
jgi:hypothetical protein